jgi:hypothetical protein
MDGKLKFHESLWKENVLNDGGPVRRIESESAQGRKRNRHEHKVGENNRCGEEETPLPKWLPGIKMS